MKTNYFLITFISFFALIFLSSNSTYKNANIDNNKEGQINNSEQQTANQTDTIVAGSDLFKIFKELTSSNEFKIATLTAYDWSSINLGVTDDAGCEIINQKEDDFIVLSVWQLTVGKDTISFQILKETADYSIYAYNENGTTSTPYMEESGFFVFKRYKNGNWETLNLKEINSSIIDEQPSGRVFGIYTYKPENKTLYIHKTEDYTSAGETFQRAGRIEQKYAWSDTQEDFIYSRASDLPNPILIHGGGYTETNEATTFYYAQINTGYYIDNELKNEDQIEFAIEYERANDNEHIEIDKNTNNEIVNNKDNKQLIWIKYKSEKVLDYTPMGPSYEMEVNIIEDYEILNQSPLVVTFTGYEADNFAWYEFTSRLGFKYYFNEINSNKYTLCDEETDKANPEFIGKKFKIISHTELVDDEFGGGKSEYEVIDSIELINN